jgi:hypothetical protein
MSSSSCKNQRVVATSTEDSELLERKQKIRRVSLEDEEEHRLLSSSKKSKRKRVHSHNNDNNNNNNNSESYHNNTGMRQVSLDVANINLEKMPVKKKKKKIKVLGNNKKQVTDNSSNDNDAKGSKQQLRFVVNPSSGHVMKDDDDRSTQIRGAIDSNMGHQKTSTGVNKKTRLITPQSSSIFFEEQTAYPPPPKREEIHTSNFDDDDDIGLEIDIISVSSSTTEKTTFSTVVVNTETTTCEITTSYPKKLTNRQNKTGIKFWMRLLSLQLFIQLLVVSMFVGWNQASSKLSITEENSCIYVSGGGFSGFWFSLGRLRTIPEPETKTFVCYSAGCLGVVATLSNYSMEQLYEPASRIQKRVWDGSVHRYNVVETFVDFILDNSPVLMGSNSSSIFSKLHIVTSVPDPQFGFHAAIQTPTDVSDLKKLLMQTTWIPLAVGSHFSHLGHLDGIFSAFQHPTCKHQVGLAWTNAELMMNTLNVNLGPESVERLWDMGLEYGL